jgi:hypothetical protein
MATLPNGAGGYQIGDGNLNEPDLFIQQLPITLAAPATVTAQQLSSNNMIVYTGAAGAITLPTAVSLDAYVSSAVVNHSFEFYVINTSANTATVTAGTGWTLVGVAAISTLTSATWRARKAGDGSWTAYRLA